MPAIKGKPTNGFEELKQQHNFRLTNTAYKHLGKLAKKHGMSTRTEVLESVARPDGGYVVIPRRFLEDWMNEAEDRTSPRWQQCQKLLGELKEYLP